MISFRKLLDEKLKASDDMGDWVKDFQDSDAPQFKGKSQKKRQQMAVAAKLSAERDAGMREEVELDEAAPKMKGDWLKKERERNREHDAAMGRTPTGRKKPVRQMTSTQKSLAKMRGEEVELGEAFGQGKQVNHANIEKAMRKALKDKGNYKNGKVLWNFIDADVYMDIKPSRGQVDSFYKMFDNVADKLSKEMNLSEAVELDEVLDTPEKMDRYKAKAKYSRDRAASSATAIALRSKDAPQREHPAKDLKTMAKRTAGLRMADKLATKRTFKALRKEEVELDEQTQYDLIESYLLENNIDVDALSIEQLDEIIGKVIGGAFKVGAKAAVGAARLAKKAVVNKQGNIRGTRAAREDKAGDRAEKEAKKREAEYKRRKRIQDAEKRSRDLANKIRNMKSGSTA